MRAVGPLRKAVAFLEELFPCGLGHVQREDLLAHRVAFLLRVVLLERHHLNLIVENRIQAHDAAHRVQLVENALLLFEIERNVRGNEIRELAAVLLLHHAEQNIRRHMAEPADILLEFLLRDAAERLGLIARAEIRLRARQHRPRKERFLLHDRHDLGTRNALHMQLDALVRGVDDLLDFCDHADFIEVVRRRLVFREVRLRDDEDFTACVQRGLNGQHRFLSADVKL